MQTLKSQTRIILGMTGSHCFANVVSLLLGIMGWGGGSFDFLEILYHKRQLYLTVSLPYYTSQLPQGDVPLWLFEEVMKGICMCLRVHGF